MSDQVLNMNPNYDRPGDGGRGAILIKRISWPAVFAGTLVALGAEVLFLMFGLYIGLQFGGNVTPWNFAWFLFSSFCCLAAGGWVAARLSGNPRHGSLHGIVTWGVSVFATFLFVALVTFGTVRQAVALSGNTAIATAQAAPNTAGPNEASRMEEQALNNMQGQAAQATRNLVHPISTATLAAWIGLLCAAVGAAVGGAVGAPKDLPEPTRA